MKIAPITIDRATKEARQMYEELLADDDATVPTQVPRLRVAQLGAGPSPDALLPWLAECARPAEELDGDAARALLQRMVAEYQPAQAAQVPG